jgi:manganese oxidase
VMGERGMADMTEMEMPLPDNTAPMMTGEGPYESVAMGGMFSMLKVRRDQKAGDYKDPGWYQQPAGTQAYEWTGPLSEPARFQSELKSGFKMQNKPVKDVEVQVRKPNASNAKSGHTGH